MGSGRAWHVTYIDAVSAQAPSAVVLVRAEKFLPNPATAADNAFQTEVPEGRTDEEVSAAALAEMDAVAEALRSVGVRVHVFADPDHTRPDSVFPTTGSRRTPAAWSASTRCTPPTVGTSAAATSSRC